MTLPPSPGAAPRRHIPRWLIVVVVLGSIATLMFCGLVVIGVLAFLGSQVTSTAALTPPNGRAIYDVRADANHDIAQALSLAKRTQKRVLLDFGADWCPDCVALANLFEDRQVKPFLDEHYVVVRINVGKWDANLDIAQRYGDPIAKGIPAVVILDAQGGIVTSTAGGELANARTATPQDVLAFLRQWAR